MLKLDIGCGNAKRAGFVGVDLSGDPDVRCDISHQSLPFPDRSADYIYSAHCLEHIKHDHICHVFQEMTRVSSEGARIEIWHPHWSHSDAFVAGHVNYIGESIYDHLGCTYRDMWKPTLGARWLLEEIRYGIDGFVIEDMALAGVNLDFAASYYREVIREIGVFVTIMRADTNDLPNYYRRSVCRYGHRSEITKRLSDGPRQSPLGAAQGVTSPMEASPVRVEKKPFSNTFHWRR